MEEHIPIILALFTTGGALIGAILGTLVTHRREVRFKKMDLIASAYKVATARIESLYRIRRRSSNPEYKEADTMNIRDELHNMQQDTEYYTTMLKLESKELGERYEKLIETIRIKTGSKMKHAWETEGNISGNNEDTFDMALIEREKESFLDAARKFTKKCI